MNTTHAAAAVPTARLQNGIRVLAHANGSLKTFANRTQALRAIAKLSERDIVAHLYQSPLSRVHFVEVPPAGTYRVYRDARSVAYVTVPPSDND
jgi:hypothetical protein